MSYHRENRSTPLVLRLLPIIVFFVVLLGVLWVVPAILGLNEDASTLAAAPEPIYVVDSPQPTATVAIPTVVLPTATVTATPTPGDPSALDLAWAAEDWPQVIPIVEGMLKAASAGRSLTEKLFSAHFNHAMQLVRVGRPAEAVAAFDKALLVIPGDPRAVGERKLAQLYQEGLAALSESNYAAAIAPLRTLYDDNPGYHSVKTRLYQAYIGYADALEKAGKKTDAYSTYQKAAQIDAQGAEAQAGVARLKDSLPKPAVGSKKIEVDIAKQRVTAWDGNQVVFRFKASTGRAPYLTRKGNFTILNHIPDAYSSAMGWGMPWWMGIYQAGKWENGFHAMARLRGGRVLPESVLGTPQTHGCIMLSDRDAKTLYDWAPVGTPVWIH